MIKATAEKTSSIFSGFTSKISQMKNSESFKSFEERVGGAYENVKVILFTDISDYESVAKNAFQYFRLKFQHPVPAQSKISRAIATRLLHQRLLFTKKNQSYKYTAN